MLARLVAGHKFGYQLMLVCSDFDQDFNCMTIATLSDAGVVKMLAALAHGHRLAIFRRLIREGARGLNAGELAETIGVAASGCSFHVKELQNAGLVVSVRQGRFVRYTVEVEAVRSLFTYLGEQCCDSHPELCGFRTTPARAAVSKGCDCAPTVNLSLTALKA